VNPAGAAGGADLGGKKNESPVKTFIPTTKPILNTKLLLPGVIKWL
jgi:hypothetical protein